MEVIKMKRKRPDINILPGKKGKIEQGIFLFSSSSQTNWSIGLGRKGKRSDMAEEGGLVE